MPVRIYDLAKKLGLESNEVLAKAKELGIAAAKVPSSSLDKITAEYLESQFTPKVAVPEPSPPAAPTSVEKSSEPAAPPVLIREPVAAPVELLPTPPPPEVMVPVAPVISEILPPPV